MKMTNLELIGWFIVITGVIVNTGMNVTKNKRSAQNQQILIDEIEALRKELKERKD